MKDLERGNLSYTIEKFLSDLKEEFRRENNKMIKIIEFKKVEQRSRIIEEFVQEFRKVVKRSRYKRRQLVEKFK